MRSSGPTSICSWSNGSIAWDRSAGRTAAGRGLFHDDVPVAIVATDRLIRERVAGFDRTQAIELSRLAAARPDLSRVVLRLWRAFVFPAICADGGYAWAVSYQDAALHTGNLYRLDGWVSVGRSRSGVDKRTARRGRSKVIWGWCEDRELRDRRLPNLTPDHH